MTELKEGDGFNEDAFMSLVTSSEFRNICLKSGMNVRGAIVQDFILNVMCELLSDEDLRQAVLDEINHITFESARGGLLRRLEQLGYKVDLDNEVVYNFLGDYEDNLMELVKVRLERNTDSFNGLHRDVAGNIIATIRGGKV